MKPRLLFISNLFPDQSESYRGLDNATLMHLLKDRWDIEVLALRPCLFPKRAPHWDFRDEDAIFNPGYIPIRYIPKIGGFANHHLAAKDLLNHSFVKHIAGRYDAVLGSWLYPDGYAISQLAERLKVPFAMIAQGSDVHRYLRSYPRRKAILQSLENASAIITRSRSLAVQLKEAGVAESKLHSIHNGVHLDTFCPKTQIPEHDPLRAAQVLFVGNLLPVKNPVLLMEAFAALQHLRKPSITHLTVVGKGPLLTHLQQQVKALGLPSHVTFAGPKSAREVGRLMREADLLVMSSRNEGLPNVVLEAQASGLRVVSTDVGGIGEVIDAPWKGTLVAQAKARPLAEAMLQTLQTPPFQAQLNAHASTLSWKDAADRYHAILTSLLSTQNSTRSPQ